jgi:hypothetical protein
MLVTKFFEQNGQPLLHEVLPMFDKLDDAFTDMVKDFTMNSVVRYLVSCGFSLLDKYYGKMDEGALYCAALCESHVKFILPIPYCLSFSSPSEFQEGLPCASRLASRLD